MGSPYVWYGVTLETGNISILMSSALDLW
jgi:hypothetical protein